ncbi:uncharacterized protein B0H18DRAFT_939165 [Fomitopsis serialis]|uniref:uncharacterized protein n=1 Tax=Fomitopsis serialis TaxID=139415 RepID=UPI0020076DE2|nr:uncharacterized protein B0H18DRAFT_939165 [Neoantrodia serialis]KAH9916665.1 hypothetical protein B0H18DRAFT_939165 [Neoantrodia serialis]
MSSVHAVKRAHAHLAWDNSLPPAVRIRSGDTVAFDCLDASNGQIDASSTPAAIAAFDFARLDQVNGPVHVDAAQPGDVLQVDVLAIAPSVPWGWSAAIPGFGLLADAFPVPALKIWHLRDYEAGAGYAWFDEPKGIRIPLRPFAGEMGVARAAPGPHSTIPPYTTGGNIDTRHVTAGSTLYLPVEVPGALFSMGDGHAAQGDGEVCGTAIETSVRATVRLTVIKDAARTSVVKTPHFSTAPASKSGAVPEEYYCTTGVDPG